MTKSNLKFPKWLRITVPAVLLIVWVLVGSIGGPYFGKIGDVASNDQATFLPESAESTQVNKELKKFQDENTIPAILVFSDDNKKLSDTTIAKIADTTSELTNIESVVGEVSPPIVAEDGKAALVVINASSDSENEAFVVELRTALEQGDAPVDFKVTGPVGFLDDLSAAFSGIDGLLLGVALAVVFVILLVAYRSPILPFLVLLNSIFALSASILAVYYLAQAGIVTINGQVQGILFILVIGAATDYALLYVARYREELTRHAHAHQAIVASWRRSVEPILAAGGTVSAGLLCLLLSDLNSNQALGPVGAIGIGFAVLSALTFLPNLLVIWGRRVFWPRIPEYHSKLNIISKLGKKEHEHGAWQKVAKFVGAHDRTVWVATTAVLLVSTLGLLQLRAEGVSQSDFILGESEARDGQELIDKHFPGGSGTPAQVVVSANKLNAAVAAIDADNGAASVAVRADNSDSDTLPLGQQASDIKREIRSEISSQITAQKTDLRRQIVASAPGAPQAVIDGIYLEASANIPSVDSLAEKAYPFKDATPKVIDGEVLLEVTLENKADSDAAKTTIQRLRDTLHDIDSSARVGGTTAVQLDTQISAERDRMVVIPAVLLVITIILMLLLRSIAAPLLLLVTTVLSFVATLGISALVFNYALDLPGAEPSVVLYGFIFLVALGIDYNIFLMTRVREESLRIGTRKGVLLGLVVTGGVITSAGIVLAATFAALAVIPILFLLQLSFIVAFGVLLDTLVVRSLLVPALVHDIGRAIWWPSKRHKK